MKALSFLLVLSCLCFSTRAAPAFTVTGTDTSTIATGSFAGSGGATTLTSPTAGTASTQTLVTGTTYTGGFTAGIPTSLFGFQLSNDAASVFAIIVVLRLGPQVALTVTTGSQTTGTTAAPLANTGITTTATAGTPTATSACGTYALDCAAGTLTFTLYTAATSTGNNPQICAVNLLQIAAVAGVLQYPTASAPATPYTAVIAAINTANSATSPSTSICGTGTSGTNTLLYFISTYGTTTATADQTSAFNKVKTAASTTNIASNTGYYVVNLQPTATGGIAAPSATASSNIATASKSQSRMVALLGVFTTLTAAVFGLVL